MLFALSAVQPSQVFYDFSTKLFLHSWKYWGIASLYYTIVKDKATHVSDASEPLRENLPVFGVSTR